MAGKKPNSTTIHKPLRASCALQQYRVRSAKLLSGLGSVVESCKDRVIAQNNTI